MKKKWLILLLLTGIAALMFDSRLIVRRYALSSEKIDAPVRLAVLTDFHGCDYGEEATAIIGAVDEEKPDAVLLVGDIFDDVLPWENSMKLVQKLAERYPCYYVTGNHEYWSERVDEILSLIEAAGVRTLNMTGDTITLNGQRINLCGIPDPYAQVYAAAPGTQEQLVRAVAGAEDGAYTILLAHRPELIETYTSFGFDLVVSGHAHGGQVRIPGLINGLYAPNQGFFPVYAGGLYDTEETVLVVSRGLARESTAFPRIFNRPELVIIDLQ